MRGLKILFLLSSKTILKTIRKSGWRRKILRLCIVLAGLAF